MAAEPLCVGVRVWEGACSVFADSLPCRGPHQATSSCRARLTHHACVSTRFLSDRPQQQWGQGTGSQRATAAAYDVLRHTRCWAHVIPPRPQQCWTGLCLSFLICKI